MSIKLLGVNIFQVDTVQKHELGLEVDDVKGGEGILSFTELLPVQSAAGGLATTTTRRIFDPHGRYRYVKGGTGGVLEGNPVGLETGATDTIVPHQVIHLTAEGVIQGVPMAAIPANSFGWIQVHGKHFNVNVLDAVADDVALEPGAGPSFIAATLDIGHYAATHGSVVIRKIADASSLGGAADRGICFIRW